MSNLNKGFKITSVARADLLDIMTEEEALKITDAQMEAIASKMANAYVENSFWIDLPIIVDYILNNE